jgi:hypothetical protein
LPETIDRTNIVQEIKCILDADGSVTQATKDKLILMALGYLLTAQGAIEARVEELEKYKPYMKTLAWAGGIFGAALLMLMWLVVTGQAVIIMK